MNAIPRTFLYSRPKSMRPMVCQLLKDANETIFVTFWSGMKPYPITELPADFIIKPYMKDINPKLYPEGVR